MSTDLLIAIGVCVLVLVLGLFLGRKKKTEFPPHLSGGTPNPPEPTPEVTKGVEENFESVEKLD